MSSTKHLLVVDDDDRIRNLLVKFLTKKGYSICAAASALEARKYIDNNYFDLIILDVMMPGETGVDFTKWLRKTNKTPILMLTAMGEVEDIIIGLDSGADDYLPKPFDPRELLARIRRLVQRLNDTPSNANLIKFGRKKYDFQDKTVSDEFDKIVLSSNEYLLLEFLIENKNKTVTRDQLSQLFSGISERSVDVQITRLRSKIEIDPKNPLYIKTVRGKGYMVSV